MKQLSNSISSHHKFAKFKNDSSNARDMQAKSPSINDLNRNNKPGLRVTYVDISKIKMFANIVVFIY